MLKNQTKEKLKAGQSAIGFRLDFASPYIIEILGGIGFDFVYLDLEHGPMSVESCQEMIRAAELVGLTPLVRVPNSDPGITGRYLDSGAMGIIFPHCNTKQDAQAAVKAVKYPPEGERGIGGRPLSLSAMSLADYIKAANRETMVIAMIEEMEALNNLSEILTVDGLDVLWIGRLDFSISAGVPGQVNAPVIQKAVSRIITEGRAAGKVVGVGAINADDPDSVKRFIKQGAQFFSLNTTSMLKSAALSLLKKIKTD
jgi:4-hydroxy-2-oxoheptanedioate aldolase